MTESREYIKIVFFFSILITHLLVNYVSSQTEARFLRDIARPPPNGSCDLCPDVYFPVCATNNITYMNHCFFHCMTWRWTNVSVVRRGVCIFF